MACSTATMIESPRFFSRGDLLLAPTLADPTSLAPDLPPPGAVLTPFSPLEQPPAFATPTAVPTEAPPTPTPEPTTPPTATPFIPLEALRKSPAPNTSVLGRGLRLPPGFNANVFAQGLDTVSYLAYSPDGVLFATLPGRGAVVAIAPSPDGTQAGQIVVFAQGLSNPTGVAFFDNHVYVGEAHQVVRFPYTPGRLSTPSGPEVVVPHLPAGGGFQTRIIGFGPDSKLYVSIGASCNACREAD